MLGLIFATLMISPGFQSTPELVEFGCQWGAGADPGLHVLAQTAAPGRFAPAGHPGDAIICRRSSIVLGPDDWEVGASGRILYIVEHVNGVDGRMAELDYVGGRYFYTLLSGAYAGSEAGQVERRLAEFRAAAE